MLSLPRFGYSSIEETHSLAWCLVASERRVDYDLA